MTVLRKNKDSLMAVLEAFVYDPLFNWCLVDSPRAQVRRHPTGGGGPGGAGGPAEGDAADLEQGAQLGSSPPLRSRHNSSIEGQQRIGDGDAVVPEAQNKKAVQIIQRVRDKLTGTDFANEVPLCVRDQVDRLILQATSHENLCQCYIGWCSFW
ncbi:serine/threonine-protein kinase mTOR-like [Amphibalanus amphitrite]|nr:serine/threonine-protein kinase mTOR-like [Amphibalanus amphitrite]